MSADRDLHKDWYKRDCREAADRIEALERKHGAIIAAFRANMMRLCPEYNHETFDQMIERI
jgi:hypothetical protein